ncbi:hypothetical protein CcCBS67573_g07580 [Chytriomyces confervae]|uniref:Dilute domain-containing protein n=1 Tax=Chytriomyces confervae TaxID=246404 RepID=A0A507ESE3_9FUNG|nr:hypothetical protein CcCBS67573_g07580 [Chytriomyces confervae]
MKTATTATHPTATVKAKQQPPSAPQKTHKAAPPQPPTKPKKAAASNERSKGKAMAKQPLQKQPGIHESQPDDSPQNHVVLAPVPEKPKTPVQGTVQILFNHYHEYFPIKDGVLDGSLVDDKYAFSFVHKGDFQILLHDAETNSPIPKITSSRFSFMLEDGKIYRAEIEADAEEEKRLMSRPAGTGAYKAPVVVGGKGVNRASDLITQELKGMTREQLAEKGDRYKELIEAPVWMLHVEIRSSSKRISAHGGFPSHERTDCLSGSVGTRRVLIPALLPLSQTRTVILHAFGLTNETRLSSFHFRTHRFADSQFSILQEAALSKAPKQDELVPVTVLYKSVAAHARQVQCDAADSIFSLYAPECFVRHSHPHERFDATANLFAVSDFQDTITNNSNNNNFRFFENTRNLDAWKIGQVICGQTNDAAPLPFQRISEINKTLTSWHDTKNNSTSDETALLLQAQISKWSDTTGNVAVMEANLFRMFQAKKMWLLDIRKRFLERTLVREICGVAVGRGCGWREVGGAACVECSPCSVDKEEDEYADDGGCFRQTIFEEMSMDSKTDTLVAVSPTGALSPLSPQQQQHNTHSDPEVEAFMRAASNGNMDGIRDSIKTGFPGVDVVDADGLSALLHASVWGHMNVAQLLVSGGATIDARDPKGWTPLMWACSNGHRDLAAYLLGVGASKDVRSNTQKSVWDVSKYAPNREDILPLLGENPAARPPSRSSLNHSIDDATYTANDELTDDDDESEPEFLSVAFDWKSCRFDQMIVFDEDNVDHILHLAMSDLRKRVGDTIDTQQVVPPVVAANIIFLCARYAHYVNPPEVLERFFEKTFAVIHSETQSNQDSLRILALWISNCHHLVYYLKRDEGLRSASYQYQASFSEVVNDLYEQLIASIRKAMLPLMEGGIVAYTNTDEPVKSPHVQMESILGVFSGTGKRNNSVMRRTGGILSSVGLSSQASPTSVKPGFFSRRTISTQSMKTAAQMNPGSLVKFFGSVRDMLSTSNLHCSIIHQLFKQVFRILNAELFNRIISSSDLLSRSKATRISNNLSVLIDWLQDNDEMTAAEQELAKRMSLLSLTSIGSQAPAVLPYAALFKLLTPTMQLLHFTKVITSTESLFDYLSLKSNGAAVLTIPQVRRAMSSYHFEVGEPNFADDVEDFVVREWEEYLAAAKAKARQNGDDDDDDGIDELDRSSKGKKEELLDCSIIAPLQVPTFNAFAEDIDSIWRVSGMLMEPVVPSEILEVLDGVR